jgi:hypothetical protein
MTPSMSDELNQIREAMRWLQLPVSAGGEQRAVEAAAAELEHQGIDPSDGPSWIGLEIERWRDSGSPSSDLLAIVSTYMEAGDPELGPQLMASYFQLHARLKGQPLIDHDSASAILSHARLIILLATEENLSAAQIAKLINARDHRVPIAWPEVGVILGELGLTPSLSLEGVEGAYKTDQEFELEIFADADEDDCISMVTNAAGRLGFPGDLEEPLARLFFAEKSHGPYLQMLHIQCTVAELYDHALNVLYEFNPRGQAANWLFNQYPSSITAAREPFVNNAKSVDEMTRAWATSKRRQPAIEPQAHALVTIIEGLDSMGFAARRELASWLRRLLARRIRLAKGMEISLPAALSSTQVRSLVEAISADETGTRGILEQRIVDAVAVLRYPPPDWLSRGLLDSVNATNVSSRKCGDCDFQNASIPKVVAYEAHAGRLTDVYVESHIRTLKTVLRQRAAEWEENFGAGLDWTVKVIFVAHAIETGGVAPQTIEGVSLETEATTYEEFLADLDCDAESVRVSVNDYVRTPLAAARTPDSIRSALLAIIDC